MRSIEKASLLAILALANVLSHSSISRADEPPKPELIKIAGEPVRLKFADGREAVMKITALEIPNLSIPFSITENTCNDKVGASCKYLIPSRYNTFFFAWTKNPDISKIGQQIVVPASNGSSADQLEFNSSLSSLNRVQFPNAEILKSIPNQSISCPSLDWFESNDRSDSSARNVRSISTEFALQNMETGVDENRFYATTRDIKLVQTSKTTLEVRSAALPKSTSSSIPYLFFGDAAWYVKINSGEVCQFTSRAKFSDATTEYQAVLETKTKPEDEKTIYIYGNHDSDALNKIDASLENRVMQNAEKAK